MPSTSRGPIVYSWAGAGEVAQQRNTTTASSGRARRIQIFVGGIACDPGSVCRPPLAVKQPGDPLELHGAARGDPVVHEAKGREVGISTTPEVFEAYP